MTDTAAKNTRNHLGHWENCNYWDWQDFTKCECSDGLASVPEPTDAFVVSPMPMLDYFAGQIDIPWEEAVNFAVGMKQQQSRIETLGDNPNTATLAEICGARARLRYFEAAAMMRARALIHVPDAIAKQDEEPSDWACACRHEPERHEAVIRVGKDIEGGPCDQCDCKAYRITETKRLSLVKEGHADDDANPPTATRDPLVSLK